MSPTTSPIINTEPHNLEQQMPRSKDPRNYGPIYEKLVDLMDKGQDTIELTMGHSEAHAMRHSFYAYINAMKHEAERISKAKHLEPGRQQHLMELWIRKEDVARGYIVFLEKVTPDQARLRFIRRDLDERFLAVADQLDEMLASNPNPTYDEFKHHQHEGIPTNPGTATRAGRDVVDTFRAMVGDNTKLEDIDTTGTTQADIDALSKDPPIRDDLSDLITESNQPASPTKDDYTKLMTQHLLPEKESKKSS